jgi:hypothetical protein
MYKYIMSKTIKTEIQLFEKVDMNKLKLLLSSNDISDQLKQQLKTYYTKKDGESIPVNYIYSKKISDKGRLFAQHNLSLQNFRKDIRHTLAKDIYYDIDMCNSGATILLQYCEKNNIETKYLDKYVNDRENFLKSLQDTHEINRDEAKELMIRLFFLGSYVISRKDKETGEISDFTPKDKLNIAVKFQSEMKTIAARVCEIEEDTYKIVEKNKEKIHKKSAVLAITYHILENKCLMAMYNFFTKQKKINVGVLCFDGLMIEKNNINAKKLDLMLTECEKYVFSKTGYNIKLMNKPMDAELSFELPEFSNFVSSDREAQERLFEIEGSDKFKFCKGDLYIFNDKTGMYETSIETLYYYLTKNSEYLNIVINDNKTDNYGESSTLMHKVIPFVKTAAKDDDWLEATANSSLGYLLFKDGYYNMKLGVFKKKFTPKIVFHCRVPWNFPERDKTEIKNAHKLSFGNLFEDPKPMIAALARALAGDIKIKKFYLCPGKTNAGKSFLGKMLALAFGQYIGYFNAESLAYTSSKDTKDEAAKMRWSLLLRFSRILLSNEVNMKKKLNGNDIKKHSSGGDKLTGRTHNKVETHYVPHYTIFCMLNDIPNIEPMDSAVMGRLEYIEFPFQFVAKSEAGNKNHYKIRDEELDNKIERNAFINGFIHIILDGYKDFIANGMPKFDAEVKDKWTSDNKQNSVIVELIEKNFEITKDPSDKILVQEMKNFKNTNKKIFSTISYQRYNEILKDEFDLEEGRIGNSRAWCGIKKKDDF